MDAIPANVPRLPAEVVSGMSCPDCHGVLRVATDGTQDALRFRCRTGHLYSADEVFVGKEKRLEESLWGAVKDLDELATLLEQLVVRGVAAPRLAAFEARARTARTQAGELRGLIQRNEPIDLVEPSVGDVDA